MRGGDSGETYLRFARRRWWEDDDNCPLLSLQLVTDQNRFNQKVYSVKLALKYMIGWKRRANIKKTERTIFFVILLTNLQLNV